MNLEVFNKVNWKESYHSSGRTKNQTLSGMYSNWSSLTKQVYDRSCHENLDEHSVLCKFTPSGGKQVAMQIVKQLASNLGITQAAERSNLTTEKEILWCMEVICYGLSLPLTEHDIVRDCVSVYCEWLSALYTDPKISVPKPVCEDPNFFARKIIGHFLNLFLPRNGEGSDIINKQAVLCHRVLRTLQQVTQDSKIIENDTWQTILLFLLTINDTLLAPPTIKDDVGDLLCERVLSVLLEVWLIACVKCYPSPPLWKTLREMAINWRHRTALIEQWNRINLTLTSKILEIMYGVSFSQLKIIGDEELQTTVNSMSEECVVQTWFRMLHTVGNPVDLCRPHIISQSQQFLLNAIAIGNATEHPCLSILPLNFYKAIKGVASLVDGFLGTPVSIQWEDYPHSYTATTGNVVHSTQSTDLSSPTPPSRRRLAKSFSVTSSKNAQKIFSSNITSSRSNVVAAANANVNTSQTTSTCSSSSLNYVSFYGSNNRSAFLSPLRPKCNSVLHLFGEWLFEAAYNSEIPRFPPATAPMTSAYSGSKSSNWGTTAETGSISSSGSISSFLLRKGSSSQPNSLTTDSSDTDTTTSTPQASLPTVTQGYFDKFVSGRAEAVGTLCRIICAKKTGEEILPIYLSRFYMVLQQSLKVKEYGECDEVMASVLLNSAEIFSIDLDGVSLLVPYFVDALEVVLPERNFKFNENSSVMWTLNNASAALSNSASVSQFPSMSAPTSSASAGIPGSGSASLTTAAGSLSSSAVAVNNMSFITMNTSSSTVVGVHEMCSDSGNVFNSTSNLSIDDGSVTLTPGTALAFASALSAPNATLSTSNIQPTAITSTTAVSLIELRKACIHLLLSMLPLPLHLQNFPLKEFGHLAYRINFSGSGFLTYGQLKPRLVNLLLSALQFEIDSCNTPLLLGGLLFAVQDSVICEQSSNVNSSTHDNLSDSGSSSPPSDCAYSLYSKSVHLVCYRLISSCWKLDLNISLAALEFLTSLAQIKIREINILEYKRAVKWLCDFIVHQCGRPPQAHSKDLHSSIVAAFQCTSYWLLSHPSLLDDKDCLNTLLEVVELGISGTKSQGKRNEPIRMKDEKELKPVSMRVRDAAEALLTIILEQRAESGTCSNSCLLDETILVKQCSTSIRSGTMDHFTYEEAVSKFHYFLFENNILIALLQEPLGNDQDPQPSITLLIRNCFGRHSWTFQLRHLPRHRSTAKQNYGNLISNTTGRPIAMNETSAVPVVNQKFFPDCITKMDSYKVDKAIPLLEEISDGANDEKLEALIEEQHKAEMESSFSSYEPFRECNPPNTCNEFYTARMFLSHLGLLSKYKNTNKEERSCSLLALDSNMEGFARELRNLDELTGRTCDTCHVFYVKSGQKRHVDILENTVSRSSVSHQFIEVLYSLGWPVKINKHDGWTGHVSTSYKISDDDENFGQIPTSNTSDDNLIDGVCLYDGVEKVLCWQDAMSEIAFVIPSLRRQAMLKDNLGNWYERTGSVSSETMVSDRTSVTSTSSIEKCKPLPADVSTSADSKPSSVFSKKKSNIVTVVMLVWLESFEDHAYFPANELLQFTNTGLEGPYKTDAAKEYYVIFLHALQNDLLRVKLQGPLSKINIAIPLVDGMVISRRTAGQLVRQTVLNICKRRRLDCDSYQLPHVRRRLKLQEMKDKFECKLDLPELLTYLVKTC